MPRTRPAQVHQLKVVLRDTEVWRRLQVPSSTTLAQLHDVIQRAMGWQDYHLHDFEIDGVAYGTNDGEDWGRPVKDEHRARLEAVAPVGTLSSTSTTSGGAFDPEHFDLAAVNDALSYVAAR